jgi:predicted DNA-binding transcriptional regulator AlpA
MDEQTTTTTLLTAAAVKARYGGVSDMSLWRWARDPSLGFPAPLIINGRKFWRESELAAWEASRPRGAGRSVAA